MYKNKVLIIGGNGFIGSTITDHLHVEGYTVGVYDMTMTEETEGISFYRGDIIHDSGFPEICSQYNTIIYLISAIMPEQSMIDIESSYATDIPLLLKTLEICRQCGIKRIVYASSGGTIYGDNYTPNYEDQPNLRPVNHYAICKLTCENILQMYNRLYGMENIILRISNPYGVRQKTSSGVGAVSTFVRKALASETIIVYGDGENVRDFIKVENVACAFRQAVEWEFVSDISPLFNIGTSVGISLNRLLSVIQETLNIPIDIQYKNPRDFDVRTNVLDTTKAHKYLRFDPSHDVEKDIKDFIHLLAELHSGGTNV